MRERICQRGLEDVLDWLENNNGEVAVFDATNTTRERRKYLYNRVVIEKGLLFVVYSIHELEILRICIIVCLFKGFKLFFVESLCDDTKIVESNIREVKVTSPDYTSYNADQVYEDFVERIKHYEKQYETIDEDLESSYSFLKIFNAGSKHTIHKHEGHIQSRIVYYLMNVKITPRTIYLTRHGKNISKQLLRVLRLRSYNFSN